MCLEIAINFSDFNTGIEEFLIQEKNKKKSLNSKHFFSTSHFSFCEPFAGHDLLLSKTVQLLLAYNITKTKQRNKKNYENRGEKIFVKYDIELDDPFPYGFFFSLLAVV